MYSGLMAMTANNSNDLPTGSLEQSWLSFTYIDWGPITEVNKNRSVAAMKVG